MKVFSLSAIQTLPILTNAFIGQPDESAFANLFSGTNFGDLAGQGDGEHAFNTDLSALNSLFWGTVDPPTTTGGDEEHVFFPRPASHTNSAVASFLEDALNQNFNPGEATPSENHMRGSDKEFLMLKPNSPNDNHHQNIDYDLDNILSEDQENQLSLLPPANTVPNSPQSLEFDLNIGESITSPGTQNFQKLTIALEALLDGMSGTTEGTDIMKEFSGKIGASISQIDNYGCWCYFGSNHGKGRGKPIDPIDNICKVLHDGYECAMRDAEEEGTTCVPWEADYQQALGMNPDLTLREECSKINKNDNCGTRSCIVEGNFIRNLLEILMSGYFINDSLKHDNGFDPKQMCLTKKTTATGGHFEKSCCGNYPDRFPFRTSGGLRQCCGYRTFNALTLKCCDAETSTVKFNC